MERVTDERLAYLLERLELRWAFIGPDEIESVLRELQSCRAADSPAPKAEPSLFDKDLVDLVCYYERYIMDNWTDTPDERSRMADATVNALTQLQGYRAAEREQAAPEPRKLDEVTCAITVNPGAYEAAMAVAGSKIAEFIRAKQPKPRTPAKWERRLAKMVAYLHYTGTKWEVWLSGDSDLFKTVYDGATIRAAVEAAWEAWRREEI